MRIPRIMIAAPKSGSGKTMITCAFLQALKNRGETVVSYKCGPDYIDGMFHEKILGIPARNLDTFFTDEAQTRMLLASSASENGFAVMEGAMGLYDGLGGICKEGSSYHLAQVTETPIVLVADAKGMGRSVIPMLAGFLAYDEAGLIRGVILNRASKGYYEVIKPLIEEELNIEVLGRFPSQSELQVESRHLGLILPDEISRIREKMETAAECFCENISMERILQIAGCAKELEMENIQDACRAKSGAGDHDEPDKGETEDDPVIAVARDEAFCFYYEENLELLKKCGAKLVFFSPLHDEKLPRPCHGILLGGGYPELYAGKLSGNIRMRSAVKQAAERQIPIVAECGGFLYLHSILCDREGVEHEMAGILSGKCFDVGKLVRFGYIELQEKEPHFLPEGGRIKGHEFHYYDSTENGENVWAVKPVTGKKYSCMIERANLCLGFAHLYYPSNPAFAESFAAKARKYKAESEQKGEGRCRGQGSKIYKA